MKLIKFLLGAGVLLVSFSVTSYMSGLIFARQQVITLEKEIRNQEQKQNDFIHGVANGTVVEIRDPENKKGGGTGFFVNTPSGNTLILTNNHVCGLAENNFLLINQTYFSVILAHSPDHDLCPISNPLNEDGLDVASSSRNGQDIYIVGHPLLEPTALVKGEIAGTMNVQILMGYDLPCTDKNEEKIIAPPDSLAAALGIGSACIRNYESQATTCNILPGNSGSPVLNEQGQVVGVVFAGNSEGPGRGYIIPLSYVQKFLGDK